jgi:hypothetical protein
MSSFEIEVSIPVPVRTVIRDSKYPFAEMGVGDSFLVPQTEEDNNIDAIMKRMSGACAYAGKMLRAEGIVTAKFIKRRMPDGVRVWRAA